MFFQVCILQNSPTFGHALQVYSRQTLETFQNENHNLSAQNPKRCLAPQCKNSPRPFCIFQSRTHWMCVPMFITSNQTVKGRTLATVAAALQLQGEATIMDESKPQQCRLAHPEPHKKTDYQGSYPGSSRMTSDRNHIISNSHQLTIIHVPHPRQNEATTCFITDGMSSKGNNSCRHALIELCFQCMASLFVFRFNDTTTFMSHPTRRRRKKKKEVCLDFFALEVAMSLSPCKCSCIRKESSCYAINCLLGMKKSEPK